MASILYAAYLGTVSGVLPVYLGLVAIWFFKRIPGTWRTVLVSFSAGILLFLFADVLQTAILLATIPGLNAFLLLVGLSAGLFSPALVSRNRISKQKKVMLAAPNAQVKYNAKIFAAYMVSVGIGLHNFGEGLALGAAYAARVAPLTALLVVGYALHNGTEGLGIAAPLSTEKTNLRQPALMGLIAGVPTVAGSMLGSAVYSEAIGSLFFAAAAGALLYVILELVRISHSDDRRELAFLGVFLGITMMYLTGLILSGA